MKKKLKNNSKSLSDGQYASCICSCFSDHVSSILWCKDEQGRFLYVNKAFEDYSGLKLSFIYGKKDADLKEQTKVPLIWESEMNTEMREERHAYGPSGKRCYDVRVN